MGKPSVCHETLHGGEYIVVVSERGEVKHLSTRGKRKQKRFRK